MTLYSSLANEPVRSLDITIPLYGAWTANLLVASNQQFNGTLDLKLADLVMVGTVVRSGDFTSSNSVRLVGGYGGWKNSVPHKFYRNPFGLKLSVPLNDVAREAGEQISIQQDPKVGSFYMRSEASASRVLATLAPRWFIRPDGVTEVGERPEFRISSDYTVVDANLSIGKVTIQTENPADWLPGCTFASVTLPQVLQASAIVHKLSQNRLLTDVWIG